MNYNTNDLKNGLKLLIDGSPMVVIENEFVKPGKGQAFNRVKLRNLKNGRIVEKTFKSGESIDIADVLEVNASYSYFDGDFYVFMNNETFEQYNVNKLALTDSKKWIKEQDQCNITLFNGEAINVIPPNFVKLRIIETDPGVKGDTAGTGGKPATLETGAVIKVPLFLQVNDLIKVDTRTSEYVARIKE